jgi:KDO2-lipid IV(A) lauroyltransferase
MEFVHYPNLTKADIQTMVGIKNREVFDDLARRGQGALVVGAHWGSWELLAAACVGYGYPLAAIARSQHNKLSEKIFNQYREMMGIRIIRTGINVRDMVKGIREKMFILMISDQDAGPNGVFVDFLGRPAAAPIGPALFHLRYGVPLVVCMNTRNTDGTYTMELRAMPALPLTGDEARDIPTITQWYYTVFEEFIRKDPGQWFWVHRRWKTKKPADQ